VAEVETVSKGIGDGPSGVGYPALECPATEEMLRLTEKAPGGRRLNPSQSFDQRWTGAY